MTVTVLIKDSKKFLITSLQYTRMFFQEEITIKQNEIKSTMQQLIYTASITVSSSANKKTKLTLTSGSMGILLNFLFTCGPLCKLLLFHHLTSLVHPLCILQIRQAGLPCPLSTSTLNHLHFSQTSRQTMTFSNKQADSNSCSKDNTQKDKQWQKSVENLSKLVMQ